MKEVRGRKDTTSNYIPSKENPVDIASRGVSMDDLLENKLWWVSPKWLIQSTETWPVWNCTLMEKTEKHIQSEYKTEAKAIDIALYHIRDQPEKQFIIYSDSLSVLRSLKNLDHRNPLIQQILRKFNYLSSFKEIVFYWLPSHTNIRGNELADLEAKSALSLSITNLKNSSF